MKKLFALILALSASVAIAGPTDPNQLRDTQNNANNPANGTITRYTPVPPNGQSCIRYFNGTTILPDCMLIGSGLSILNGELVSTAPAQQPADWNALSGPTSIVNKPTFATVAFSGQAADLSGLATVATTGAYASLSGRPSLATVATSGDYNDLTNKPSIPAAYTFTVGAPTTRTVSLATAYQCTTSTKPCAVTVTMSCPLTLSILAGATCAGEVRIGSTNAVATGGGTNVAPIQRNASGIVGLSTNDYETKTIIVPAGWYFAVRQITGTGMAIIAAYDQVQG